MSVNSLDDWLERSDRIVGLVFADIVGSTFLLHRLKTDNFDLILRQYRARGAGLAAQFDGRLIDEKGDELLAAFPSATRAYLFAASLFQDPGHPHLSVRAGVHFGAVQARDRRLVGRTVHLGLRVMEHGRDHELWVSDAAKAALDIESPTAAAGIVWITSEECELKGIPETQRLWRAG